MSLHDGASLLGDRLSPYIPVLLAGKDCESCTSDIPSSAKIDRIEKIITFNGNLTDEQRKKLFEISERCPVKMTLQRENEIISRFE